jgi:hypothetical protein
MKVIDNEHHWPLLPEERNGLQEQLEGSRLVHLARIRVLSRVVAAEFGDEVRKVAPGSRSKLGTCDLI